MARRTGAGGSRILAVLPFVLSLLALILVIVTLAAGTRPGVLDTFDFVTVDTSNLHIGAKLADSAQLKDLSTVSGVDLVGQDLTASSLGLGTSYTITVLSSCSHGGGGSGDATTCTSPRVGYAFDPRTDLKLDQTAVAGTFPPSFTDDMAAYSKASTFVASGYLATIVFLLIASISAALASRAHVAGFGSVFFSVAATIFLLALSVVSRGGAGKLVSALNDNLSSVGISASVGSLFVLTWVATVLSLLATVGYALRMRSITPSWRARRGQVSMARSVAVTGQEPDKMSGAVAVGEGAPPKAGLGLWGKMPTWKSHRYVQIERQPAIVRTDAHGHEEAMLVHGQISPPGRSSLDEQDITQGQRGIKMVSLGQGGRKDMNTAYEPYKRTQE